MTAPRIAGAALLALAACHARGTGTVQVFIEAEDTITDGLDPGDGEEDIVDGWAVRYDKFLVTIGDFHARPSDDDALGFTDDAVYIADLKRLPAGGLILTEFSDAALRWDHVGYSLPDADERAEAAAGLADADHARMVAGGYSLYVEGEIRKADGRSCLPGDPDACAPAPVVRFAWGLRAGTSFADCAGPDGVAGFAIPAGGTVQVKPTVHGDHWFFTTLTQGAEITRRRAQWIADADLDRDGETTLAELRQIPAFKLFPAELGYNLSGALIPIVTAYDYLEAQARTLGDFQGEGECPTRDILR